MKNTNKLLVVLLALAIAVSGIAVTTMTTNADDADTTVYLEYNGVDCNVAGLDEAWHTDRARGDSLNIDYYEKDMYAPMSDGDKASLEVGKVYKALYIYTFQDVAEPGWEIKFMPTEEYYYNITNGDVWKGQADTKTVISVPFKVTNTGDVKLKNWQHGGMRNDSKIDKIMIVGADFNAYTIEGVDIVMEGVANAGSKVNDNKPADDEWTPSDKYMGEEVPENLGINSYLYYMPGYLEIIGEDSRGASVSFENNTKFDDTIYDLISTSYLVETTPATSISIHGDGDWFIQKWTGTMVPQMSGDITLVGRKIDNGFVMIVNGQKVYEYWGASHWFDGASDRLPYGTSFTVEQGQSYDVEIYYMELDGGNVLEIFASLDPTNDGASANINDVATFDLTMEKYVVGDNTGEFNKLVGIGVGDDGANGGNGGQCIEENWKYEESIGKIMSKAWIGESKVVETFSDAIVNKECYVISYDGYIEPKVSGTYVFGANKADNGFYLNIDGTVAYEYWAGGTWNDNGGNTYPTGIELEAGVKYPFDAAFLETNGGQVLDLVATVDGGERTSVNDLFTFYTELAEEDDDDEGGSGATGTSYIGTDDFGNSPLTVIVSDSTVTFEFNHPMMGPSSATYDYEIVAGEMVLYDETGAVLNPLAGRITLTDGVPTAADYNGNAYTLVASDAGEDGGDEGGDENDVIQLNWPMPGFTTDEMAAGEEQAYAATGFNGYDLIIEDADAYVVHNGQTYYAEGGVVKVTLSAFPPMMPAEFVIGNNSSEAKVFDVTLSREIPVGSVDNPEVLEETGNYSTDFAEGDEAYFYTWTAPADGVVTITINNDAGWLYAVNNLTTGVYGDNHWFDDEVPVPSETLNVSAGDELKVLIATYSPDAYGIVEGTIDWTLAFETEGDDSGEEGERTPDTNVYEVFAGDECFVPGNDGLNNEKQNHEDGTYNLDYYEQDLYAPFDSANTTLEEGKVYKAIYLLTINTVNNFADTGSWEAKFMPTEEYYFNITNADIWDGVGPTNTAVVVPFKVTDLNNVKMKMWTHGALIDGSCVVGMVIVGADFNAWDLEGVTNVVEGVANVGSNVENNKPADDEWTVSDPNAAGGDEGGNEGEGGEGSGDGEGTGDGEGDGSGDSEEQPPVTGAVASAMALLLAGAAAMGGLKLRKR